MLKSLVLGTLFSRWPNVPGNGVLQEGYTIILPSPMDMPFLLRYALEGLVAMDTQHCRQILVVPDGWGTDGGAGLRAVVQECTDPRVEMVELSWLDYRIIHAMKPPGSAATHWMMVVNGTKRARCQYAFLHDADAFFLDADGLERQYTECGQRGGETGTMPGMYTLGVTPRWDPYFTKIGYEIPGTWELMYSVAWARQQAPYRLKGVRKQTPHGETEFDSMLARQYFEYRTGRIGVMKQPPRFVHFNGTIFTYRLFRDRQGQPVIDELFRVLLLALLETLVSKPGMPRVVPTVPELALGLTDPNQPVRYVGAGEGGGDTLVASYQKFRGELGEMATAPIFAGARAERLAKLLEPFDKHFGWQGGSGSSAGGEANNRFRTHGLA